MKTKFNIMCVLLIGLMLCSSRISAQGDNNGYLIINAYEAFQDAGYSKIIVTDNQNVLEEIALEKFYYKDLSSNQMLVSKTLEKYRLLGYKLIQHSRGSMQNVTITTFIMQKE